MLNIRIIYICCLILTFASCKMKDEITCYGGSDSDLVQLLEKEGYTLKFYPSVSEALQNAPEKSGVLLLSDSYPVKGTSISQEDESLIEAKSLRVLVEFPQRIGTTDSSKSDTLNLERIVVCDSINTELPFMSLLSFNRCILKETSDSINHPILVAAKVAGFDKAVYGLKDTETRPVLYYRTPHLLVSTTCISHFASDRYMPEQKIKSLYEYIFRWLLSKNTVTFSSWITYITPSYTPSDVLPENAGYESIKKGIEWFYNGHFLVNSEWKQNWVDKYMGDGTMPIGPSIPDQFQNGDGSLGVLEGHMSEIRYDGSQLYRYWMRADVQGEASYAFAAAGDLLENNEYSKVATNLIDYSFKEYRDSERNDPASPSYGLLGWAYTHKGTYYGDDNARFLLGVIASSALLNDTEWDKKIAEGLIGNFRTTGINGFRGGSLLDTDIQKRGWKSFYDNNTVNLHAHFEAWNWACYLWLYNQTQYEPLLERSKKALSMMMASYPEQWSWTNGIQQERARMILPLAWLYRVEPTEEHLKWLHYMTNELLKNQVTCGGIREELGDESKSSFGHSPSNEAYGSTEASLIFDNGDPVADMLYTTNFAFVGLCEAAKATNDSTYVKAVNQMRDFLIRIQVKSDKFRNVDGAWFRAFNYQDWNYWAANADAGWGAWSTLTGWIQSWIVGTQFLMEKNTSLWELSNRKDISKTANKVIEEMINNNNYK